MILREYIESDAKEILSWIKSERELRLWSWERYKDYPVTPKDINDNYNECKEKGEFYPMTLIDNEKIVGHLILRYPTEDKTLVRIGFIIINSDIRGKGYGKAMLQLGIKFAKEIYGAKKVSLGVFENNKSAYFCYKAVGFQDVVLEETEKYVVLGEEWKCLELEMTL